jgi:hypothetical protein
LTVSGRQDLNLRPLGPQPSALPDCATPRGVFILTDRRARCLRECLVCLICSAREAMRALQEGEVAGGIRLATAGARAAGQLLPTLPLRVSPGALPGEQTALYRGCSTAQESAGRRADPVPGRFPTGASLRRLRRGRSRGARVRPPAGQEVWDLRWHAGSPLAGRARRDCKVRGRLCKLSSTPHRKAGRLCPCGGSSTVEPCPSKAMMRVQFPSAALPSSQIGGVPAD